MSDTDPEAEPPERRRRRRKRRQWLRHRLTESVRTVRGIVAEPRSVPSQIRDGLLKIWRVRGGGFYGLGYVITFVVLEIRMFIGNFEGNNDVATMVVQEILEFVFRFAFQSLVNGFIAFGWPVFVLEYLHGWGLVALGVSWIVFDRWAKPWINARLPQLARVPEPSDDVSDQST